MDRTMQLILVTGAFLVLALFSALAIGDDSLFRAIALLLVGLASLTAALRVQGVLE